MIGYRRGDRRCSPGPAIRIWRTSLVVLDPVLVADGAEIDEVEVIVRAIELRRHRVPRAVEIFEVDSPARSHGLAPLHPRAACLNSAKRSGNDVVLAVYS